MALNIPNRLRDVVTEIFAMDSSEQNRLIDVLTDSVRPASKRAEYEKKLAEILPGKDPEWIDAALDFIFSITNLSDSVRSRESVGDEINAALRRSNNETIQKADSKDFDEFRSFIQRLTNSQGTLGLGAKAARLSTEYERTFVFSEIFSDFRSIFTEGVDEIPENAVITHSLKIHSHKNEQHKEIYFSMDKQALVSLQGAIERALKKHDTLMEMAKKLDIRVIETRGDDDE